jgi:hypothetical protein
MIAKISKIMLWPTRKINLGNYESAELSAGIELSFDKPVSIDSKEVKEGFEEGRKVVREQMTKQYEPYRKMFEEREKNKLK